VKGWGLGRGCALPSWGSGACLQKIKQFCAKNYAIMSKFWYFFPILQHKVGGGDYPPVLKVGDLSRPPCSDAYGYCDIAAYITQSLHTCNETITPIILFIIPADTRECCSINCLHCQSVTVSAQNVPYLAAASYALLRGAQHLQNFADSVLCPNGST